MTSPLAATLGSSGRAAAGLVVSGGLGVALPCASANRSRLFLEVFDDCSHVGRRLSSRYGNYLSHAKRWGTAYPLTWHHQHFTVSAP